jgi:hypothetical protein
MSHDSKSKSPNANGEIDLKQVKFSVKEDDHEQHEHLRIGTQSMDLPVNEEKKPIYLNRTKSKIICDKSHILAYRHSSFAFSKEENFNPFLTHERPDLFGQ